MSYYQIFNLFPLWSLILPPFVWWKWPNKVPCPNWGLHKGEKKLDNCFPGNAFLSVKWHNEHQVTAVSSDHIFLVPVLMLFHSGFMLTFLYSLVSEILTWILLLFIEFGIVCDPLDSLICTYCCGFFCILLELELLVLIVSCRHVYFCFCQLIQICLMSNCLKPILKYLPFEYMVLV